MTEQDLLNPSRIPTRAGVLRAAEKVAEILPFTPLLPLEVDGRTIWCKAEMLQPVGAFKIRGGWHRLTDLDSEQRARGVVAVSSGNHAQGVAWAARRLCIAATIVMPADAPRTKLEATRALGATIVLYDRATQSRDAVAAELVAQSGSVLVHAFGDPWVIEGQGSAAIEAEAQMIARIGRGPDRIITGCGGGGLASGLGLACPDAALCIVEPEGWDDVIRSLAAGSIQPVSDPRYATDCDSLQTLATFPINFALLNGRVGQSAVVTPSEVGAAMRLIFERLHLVAEPGGAVSIAAILAGKMAVTDASLVMLTGGNVDRETFGRLALD